jgi:hypothetical protein
MLDDRTTTRPYNMSLKAYRNLKLKWLKNDFCIKLTEEELKHAETLTSEIQIDQFCLGMMNKYWG